MATTRPPYHYLLCRLTSEGIDVDSIPTRVFPPKRRADRARVILRPNKEQYRRIGTPFDVRIEGNIRGSDGTSAFEVRADGYVTRSQTRAWGNDLAESVVVCTPRSLEILSHRKVSRDRKGTALTFLLSDNSALSPISLQTVSYTGDVTYERRRLFEIDVGLNFPVTIDYHFRAESSRAELHQWGGLVAETESTQSADDIDAARTQLLPVIDDLLLFASIGSRTRTVCSGWRAHDAACEVSYFRQVVHTSGTATWSLLDGLVAKHDLQEFLQTAYSTFTKRSDQHHIRHAVYALLPSGPRVIEDEFLALFGGLENLVLAFRRRAGLEYVFERKQQWIPVERKFKSVVRDLGTDECNLQQRGFLNAKLAELNRVPLRHAFDKLCEELDLQMGDLWPTFGGEHQSSLYTIRNRLAHGDPLPAEAMQSLWAAVSHLRWTLERVVLATLGWSVEKSEVSSTTLKGLAYAMRDSETEQVRLGMVLKGR